MSPEEKIAKLLTEFFKDEPYKAVLWLMVKNPLLGNVRPSTMIEIGRIEKLLKYIENQIEEGIS